MFNNPIIAKALKTGNIGEIIPVALPNGKIIRAIAATPILYQNCIVFERKGKYYIQSSVSSPKIKHNYTRRKSRGRRKTEETQEIELAWLISCQKAGVTISSACTREEGEPPPIPPPPPGRERRHIAYLRRGYWNTVEAPNVSRGWPYAGVDPRGTVIPYSRRYVLTPTAGMTVEGDGLFPLVPRPPTGTRIGDTDTLSIIVPQETFLYIPGGIDISRWLTQYISVLSDSGYDFSPGQKIMSGTPPEFFFTSGMDSEGRPTGGYIGYPLDWWWQINFTVLLIGNDCFILYPFGDTPYLINLINPRPEDIIYHVSTSEDDLPASIIGRTYYPDVEARPVPPGEAGGGWTLLWDGAMGLDYPDIDGDGEPEINYGSVTWFLHSPEIGGIQRIGTGFSGEDSQQGSIAYNSNDGDIYVTIKLGAQNSFESTRPAIPSEYYSDITDAPQACKIAVFSSLNNSLSIFNRPSNITIYPDNWQRPEAYKWETTAPSFIRLLYEFPEEAETPSITMHALLFTNSTKIDETTAIGGIDLLGAVYDAIGMPILDVNGIPIKLREYLLDNSYTVTVAVFSMLPEGEGTSDYSDPERVHLVTGVDTYEVEVDIIEAIAEIRRTIAPDSIYIVGVAPYFV